MTRETFDIVPHEGIGPVRLGMTREEVDTALGEVGDEYTPGRVAWRQSAFQADIRDGRVVFLEVSAVRAFQVRLDGIPLLEIEAERVLEQLGDGYDHDDRELGYSYRWPALELAVWRPVLPEEGDELNPFWDPNGCSFCTVGVAVRDYWSS